MWLGFMFRPNDETMDTVNVVLDDYLIPDREFVQKHLADIVFKHYPDAAKTSTGLLDVGMIGEDIA